MIKDLYNGEETATWFDTDHKFDGEEVITLQIFWNGVCLDIPKHILKDIIKELNTAGKMLELYENVKK
jgi:hypothetical protein